MEALSQMIKAYSTYQFRLHLDSYFTDNANEVLISDVVYITGTRPTIAVSSMFSLDEMKDATSYVTVVLNVLPLDHENTLAIFSYLPEDAATARQALAPIFRAAGEYQKYEISKLIITRMENFLLSKSYFEAWPSSKVEAVTKAFLDTLFENGEVTDSFQLFLF